MLWMRIACGTLVLSTSLLAGGCGWSPVDPRPDLLIGRWQVYAAQKGHREYNLSAYGVNGVGQFDFSPDSTVQINYWRNGELLPEWSHEWKTEGNKLFTRENAEHNWKYHGTYKVDRKTLVLTSMEIYNGKPTYEWWRYSRVTP